MAEEAEAEFDEAADTRVDEAVEDAVPVAAGGHDLLIGHALEVVGHGLRARADVAGDLIDRDLPGPGDGVQDPQSRVAGEDPKQRRELVDLGLVDEWPLRERWRDQIGRRC